MKSLGYSDDGNETLPEELVGEILMKLPARSLVRFKRVCKSWSSLINDPSFIDKHLQLNITRTKAAHSDDHRVSNLVLGWTRWDRSFRYTEQLNDDEELDRKQSLSLVNIYVGEEAETEAGGLLPCSVVDIPLPIRPKLLVEGEGLLIPLQSYHCNGILCLVDASPFFSESLAFYNPALEAPLDVEDGPRLLGRVSTTASDTESTLADVYTLGANSWKAIQVDVRYSPEEGVLEMWLKGNNINGEAVVWTKHLTIGPFEGIEQLVIFWKNDKLLMEGKDGTLMSYDLCTNKLTKMKSLRCSDDSSKSLPEELVEEILVRLPARSLVRFKRVCKSWNSLINDPSFVNNHLQLNITRAKAACSDHDRVSNLIMGWTRWDRSSFDYTDQLNEDDELDQKQMLSLVDIYTGEEAEAEAEANGLLPCSIVDIPLPIRPKLLVEDEGLLSPLQSYHCNGILCLVDASPFFSESLAFYNPALAKFRLLLTARTAHDFSVSSHGFGYDPRTNDYKFVRVSTPDSEAESTLADVYTLGANSWKAIQVDALYIPYEKGGVYFEGSYYWLLMETTDSESILAFDMSEDVFSSFAAPYKLHDQASRSRCWSALTVWNESLVLFCSPEVGVFEMWLKGNNSNGEAVVWTRHLTIGPLEGIRQPLIFWKNDKLLMEGKDGTLMSYDLCTNKLTKVPMDGALLPNFTDASSHVESLVPV